MSSLLPTGSKAPVQNTPIVPPTPLQEGEATSSPSMRRVERGLQSEEMKDAPPEGLQSSVVKTVQVASESKKKTHSIRKTTTISKRKIKKGEGDLPPGVRKSASKASQQSRKGGSEIRRGEKRVLPPMPKSEPESQIEKKKSVLPEDFATPRNRGSLILRPFRLEKEERSSPRSQPETQKEEKKSVLPEDFATPREKRSSMMLRFGIGPRKEESSPRKSHTFGAEFFYPGLKEERELERERQALKIERAQVKKEVKPKGEREKEGEETQKTEPIHDLMLKWEAMEERIKIGQWHPEELLVIASELLNRSKELSIVELLKLRLILQSLCENQEIRSDKHLVGQLNDYSIALFTLQHEKAKELEAHVSFIQTDLESLNLPEEEYKSQEQTQLGMAQEYNEKISGPIEQFCKIKRDRLVNDLLSGKILFEQLADELHLGTLECCKGINIVNDTIIGMKEVQERYNYVTNFVVNTLIHIPDFNRRAAVYGRLIETAHYLLKKKKDFYTSKAIFDGIIAARIDRTLCEDLSQLESLGFLTPAQLKQYKELDRLTGGQKVDNEMKANLKKYRKHVSFVTDFSSVSKQIEFSQGKWKSEEFKSKPLKKQEASKEKVFRSVRSTLANASGLPPCLPGLYTDLIEFEPSLNSDIVWDKSTQLREAFLKIQKEKEEENNL